jgi:tetratricopeptide (TPR) repeat protein
MALASFGEDIGAMIALVDRALALNPNYARGWNISGNLRLWAGQLDIAIEHIETSQRLSPRARTGASTFVIGAAHFYSRRFDQAVPNLLLAIQDDPGQPPPYRALAACYAHMVGSPTHDRSSSSCALLPLLWYRASASCRTPSTASFCCPACAWRRARRNDNSGRGVRP